MSFGRHVLPSSDAKRDVVGDRHGLVLVGMASVWFACLIFTVARLALTLQTGSPTPWWANAAGLVVIPALYAWYRRGPQTRSSIAAHGTVLVTILALVIPIAYGMTSTIWWLSLVGLAAILLGRRMEAKVWGVMTPLLVVVSVILEPYVQIDGAAGESHLEAALAKICFVVILLGMAVGFRRIAEQRASALHDSETSLRKLRSEFEERALIGEGLADQRLKQLELNSQRVAALLRLNQMTNATLQEIAVFSLEEAVRLTQSKIGYLAFLNEDESLLTMHSWSKTAMAECAIKDKPIEYPVASTGLWGEAVRQRRPVITNDYAATNPLKKGCPPGHVPLKRHMNVPVFDDSRIVLVAGVGNKEQEYDQNDARQLTLIMDGVWRLLVHKRVEASMQRSEARYRMLFASAEDGMALADAETGKLIDCNEALCRMTEREKEELVGQSQSILHPPEENAGVVSKTFEQHRRGGAGRALEDCLLSKGGMLIPVEIRTVSINMNGRNVLLGVFRDITDRKHAEAMRQQLEEKLQASQKMDAIGSLAGGVAHDFNNLLSVILSYTGFAMDTLRDEDPLKDDLSEVKNAADRAVALTRQLLAFSRKQVLEPVSLDLNQVAKGVEKMLRRILGEDIDYVQVLAPDLCLTLADPGQIEQVIMNLVVNARDAMPEGGKLTIETSNVEVDEAYAAAHVAVKPGSYVQIAVTDTGRGMDAGTKARLFEPFFTTKEKGKGTGLGLSTVYGIVQQSGGNIWVYSELGKGTTFKIYLPRDSSATTAAIKSTVIPTTFKGTETILVVEDEEALRKVAKRSLEAVGYRVLTASNGEEALLVSAQHKGDIQLLLTDVVMPRISGRVLAEELSKTRPSIKVVYMSGYTDDAITHHGVLDPGTHFIAKPFTSTAVTQKVREVLDEGMQPSTR